MKRRNSLAALAALLAVPRAFAQTPATGPVRRIGFIDALVTGSPDSRAARAAFERGLLQAGWIEGRNLTIEYRSTGGRPDQYAPVAAEMVRLNPEIILTAGDALIREVGNATSTIPIVMATVGDPVLAGFTESLARPGRNITGMSNLAVGLVGKWVELLREVTRQGAVFAVLRNLANTTHDRFWQEAERASGLAAVKTVSFGYHDPAEIDEVLARIARAKLNGLLVLADPVVTARTADIAQFALKNRLPSIYLFREPVVAGGLMSYGPSRSDNYRRAAGYVDKILRGAKVAELPIEQVREFELAFNAKTAAALGIRVPHSIMLRTTEVIE